MPVYRNKPTNAPMTPTRISVVTNSIKTKPFVDSFRHHFLQNDTGGDCPVRDKVSRVVKLFPEASTVTFKVLLLDGGGSFSVAVVPLVTNSK